LLLLWARWWALILIPAASFLVAGLVPGADMVGAVGFGTVMVLLGAWFLRTEAPASGRMPSQSIFFLSAAVIMLGLGLAAGNAPNMPAEMRWPMLIGTAWLALLGVLSARYKDPAEARPRRLGVTMYLLPFMIMLSFGLLQMYGPARPKASEAQVAAAMVEAKADKAAAEAAKEAGKPVPKPNPAKEAKKSPIEQAAMREAQQRIQLAEQAATSAEERKLQVSGSYAEFVRFRAAEFAEHAAGEFGFATVLIGMFLLGYWFVRNGIMEHPEQHLPLFRKMAVVGIPLGVGLGIVGSLISTGQNPALDRDPYQTAMALMMIGNLPACLGYVSLMTLMLHSRGPFAKVSVLAPLGRMALTNYLTHSLVSSLFFFGYAGGNYGMHRATQVGFVFSVIAVQVVFSHWWLSKFRYGPMEWLWRAITYWQVPAMRRDAAPALAGSAAA
jgi:hypothetical protein